MTQFTTLTEQTARDLIDLLRRDRAHPVGGPARVGNIGQQGQVPVRWGKTSTTPDYPTYPSSGNVVGVSLGNYEPSPLYPGATAVKTFTAYDPPIYVFATLENGTLPAVGTEVRLTWRNGRWWILQDSTGSGGGITSIVGNALQYALRDGDGSESSYPVIGQNGTNDKRVKAYPTMEGDLSNGDGTVYTVIDTPTAYTDHWLTVGQDGKYRVTASFIWRMATLSLSDAQTYLLGATPPDSTALLRYIQTMSSAIVYNEGLGSEETVTAPSTIEPMYYYDATYLWYANVTLIYYFERNGSNVTIDLRWTKDGGYLGSITRCSHQNVFVTVDRLGEL
jgi:hypothetical protein